MGSKEPVHDPAVSHGICDDCLERAHSGDTPVLVVSRGRAEAVPKLQTLLRGAPEIAIVVDRRRTERRAGERRRDPRWPVEFLPDRRATERRRTPSFYVV
jgi:hypothetical protein